MIQFSKQKFERTAPLLEVGSKGVEKNLEGFYDVWFCFGGEYCLMVSVHESTKKVDKFWWFVEIYPHTESSHEEIREVRRIQQNCYDRIAKLAEAACVDL